MDVKNAISIVRVSDIGQVRKQNEDAIASDLSTGLVLIADGMGGYKAGEIASQMTALVVAAELAELMHHQFSKAKANFMTVAEMLKKVVQQANSTVYQASEDVSICSGMGTTLVAGVFYDNKIVVGHIGDSRLYRLRAGELLQLTEDHSLLQEQINAGLITKEQSKKSNAGHLVTRALGTDPEVELEINEYKTMVGDYYILCSDGLTDLVEDHEILQEMNSAKDIRCAAKNLVQLANKHGGTDNVSVIVVLVEHDFAIKKSWMHKLWA
jgi:PPM family protein phosphatase